MSGNVANKFSVPALFLIVRIIRSWNQTGQKHAGEPDIARNIFPAHNFLLWLLVLATYLNVGRRLLFSKQALIPRRIQSAISFTVCMAALRFKASFTSADAPELLTGLPRLFLILLDESSLVYQARAVFLGIGTILLVSVAAHVYQRLSLRNKDEGKTKPVCLANIC
jgi:ethanolaminephosphotransferase